MNSPATLEQQNSSNSPLTKPSHQSLENIEHGYQDLVKTINHAFNLSFYTKNQFFRFLNNNHFSYFDRNNLDGHITSSAFVINPESTHMLLVHHRKLGKWLQAGGHWENVDSQPISLFDNAIKELQEEAYGDKPVAYEALHDQKAYHLDIHGVGDHKHYDVGYLLKIRQDIPVVVSPESLAVEWISLKHILTHAQSKEFSSQRLQEVAAQLQKAYTPDMLNIASAKKLNF